MKQRQHCLEHKRAQNNSGSTPTTKVNAPNIASTTCKNLSYITCLNCDQKGHNTIKCLKSKKNAAKDWWQFWRPIFW